MGWRPARPEGRYRQRRRARVNNMTAAKAAGVASASIRHQPAAAAWADGRRAGRQERPSKRLAEFPVELPPNWGRPPARLARSALLLIAALARSWETRFLTLGL